jgi:deazaflavin-dependent oxidoreductase (nitroreductase family)
MGGQLFATKAGLALWRRVAFSAPAVVLTSIGARSHERREIPLTYFTDENVVILIASNYGGTRHPAWYHNLLANPECELHIGERDGRFVAHEAKGADRDRLYRLAVDRFNRVFALYEKAQPLPIHPRHAADAGLEEIRGA